MPVFRTRLGTGGARLRRRERKQAAPRRWGRALDRANDWIRGRPIRLLMPTWLAPLVFDHRVPQWLTTTDGVYFQGWINLDPECFPIECVDTKTARAQASVPRKYWTI